MKRIIAVCSLAIILLVFWTAAGPVLAAKQFPSKNLIWIIPSKPGGGFDFYSRAVGRQMLKHLPKGPSIIFVNVPAGGGVEAVTRLSRAKPDGYTVGIVKVPGSIVSQLTLPFVKYDVAKLSYVGNITTDPYAVAVKKDSPLNSIKEMKEKGTVKFSTSGVGATSWVNTVILSEEVGIQPKYVHYTSSADSILSCVRGDSEAFLCPLFSALPYAESGDIKFLAAFSKERVAKVPNVSTVVEAGYPRLSSLNLSRVLAAPPNTPEKYLKVLEDAFWKAVNDKEFLARLNKAKRPIIGPTRGKEARELVLSASEVFTKYESFLKASLNK